MGAPPFEANEYFGSGSGGAGASPPVLDDAGPCVEGPGCIPNIEAAACSSVPASGLSGTLRGRGSSEGCDPTDEAVETNVVVAGGVEYTATILICSVHNAHNRIETHHHWC